MNYTTRVFLALAIVATTMTSTANADPITIKVSGFASGSIGAINFSNAVVTIFGIGDTDNVEQSGTVNLLADDFDVFFEVEGIAEGEFTDNVQAVVNNNSELGGFGNTSTNFGLFFVTNSAFETYDLTSSLGAVSGQAIFVFNVPHATSVGNLRISSGNSGTFEASVVPEPSSMCVVLVLSGFATTRRRRS